MARVAAVSRQLPSDYAFSYASAARIHGLALWRVDDAVHVTQHHRVGGPQSPGVVRHHDALPDRDVTVVNGLRVTTIERTITDCARILPPRDGLVVADSGMRALLEPDRAKPDLISDALRDLSARLREGLECGPPRGRRRARVVLDHASPFAESAKESALRWIAVAFGLPRPVLQLPVDTRLGTFYVDLGWKVAMRGPDGMVQVWLVLIEYDGTVKYLPLAAENSLSSAHDAAAAVVAEKRREDAIREVERTAMRRFESADLHDVAAAFARICGAFPRGGLPPLQPVPELLGRAVLLG